MTELVMHIEKDNKISVVSSLHKLLKIKGFA